MSGWNPINSPENPVAEPVKEWPKLMSVSPVLVFVGEEQMRLRTGQTCIGIPYRDGDDEREGAVLYAPAGHQPDHGRTVVIRKWTELEAAEAFNAWAKSQGLYLFDCATYGHGWLACARALGAIVEDVE